MFTVFIEKKFTYEQTHEVQAHFVQGSTIHFFKKVKNTYKPDIFWNK